MAEKVGEIFYQVSLDTREMIDGQRKVDRELRNTTGSLDGFERKLTQVTRAVQIFAAATFLIANTDAYTKLNAQLKLATDGYSSLAVAQDKVRDISREAQVEIGSIAVLYARITNATKELRTSQFAVGEITRSVALALKVSGATAAESSSAILQLSQAFGSGVLRGEEFNSVNEAAPRLMKALADGIGVPIARLRSMAEAGKLTTSVLVDALPKALGALEQEAKQVQTISGAYQVLKNEVMLFVGAQTTANGSAAAAAGVLSTLAANLDLVAAAAVGVGAAKLSATILAISVATVASTKATIDSIAAQRASAAAAVLDAEAKVVETAATVATTESELALTGAKIAGLQATQAEIIASRADVVQKLLSARAAEAQARAQIAAATAAGAQSYALAMLRTATAELAVAQATQARMTNYLATLGQQQAAVATQITAATAAQTAASRGLIVANGALATAQMGVAGAVGAASAAMTTASRLLGLLGGPIGIITTLLGLGATAWMLWGNSAQTAGDQAAQALAKAQSDHSGYAQAVTRLDAIIDKERAKGAQADEARIRRLTVLRERAAADEKKAWNEIAGLKAEKSGQETLERNYVTRYEDPAAVEKRQLEAQKAFLNANLSNQQKYEEESKKLRGDMGPKYTPEVDTALRKKHHLDKADPNAGKADGAKQYYEGLVAENAFALAKIDAQEREALAENQKRAAKDLGNASVYGAAKTEIQKKFARERALLEEESSQQAAELNIAITTDEAKKIQLIRDEAVRRADVAEKLGTVTHAEAERARTLATFQAEQASADLAERNARARADAAVTVTQSQEQRIKLIRDEAIRSAEEGYRRGKMTFEEAEAAKTRAVQEAIDQQKALTASRASTAVETLQIRADTTGNPEDQINLIRAQAAAQLAAVQEAQLRDLEQTQLYADQKAAIIARMNQQITDINAASAAMQLAMIGGAAGQMLSLLKQSGRERTGLAKALFVAEKAIAVATIIMQTEVAAAKATGQAGIFGFSLATLIRAQGYASAGMVAGMAIGEVAGGRQYGGPVAAGSMYRVNEAGAPEMFTGSNGQQYMLPTKSGQVTPADQVGGGVQWNIIVNNTATGTQATASVDQTSRTVEIAVSQVAAQITNNEGKVWNALRSSTNVRAGGI